MSFLIHHAPVDTRTKDMRHSPRREMKLFLNLPDFTQMCRRTIGQLTIFAIVKIYFICLMMNRWSSHCLPSLDITEQ